LFTVGTRTSYGRRGYYVQAFRQLEFVLTPPEAARYVIRAVASYFVLPLPLADVDSGGNSRICRRQNLWVRAARPGADRGDRRRQTRPDGRIAVDALCAATAAVVAVTTGNVGT